MHDKRDMVIGKKPVRELLAREPAIVDSVYIQKGKRGTEVSELVESCKRNKIRFSFEPASHLDRLYQGNHQGFIARIFSPGFSELDELLEITLNSRLKLALAMDRLEDPHNVGVMARTLYGLGGGGIIVPKHGGAFLGAGASKASAGTLSRIAITKATNLSRALDRANEQGFHIYCAQLADNGISVARFEPEFPAVLVIGGENEGVRPGVAKRCEQSIYIPMANKVDSLNAAQAGAVIMARFLMAAMA